MPKYYSLAFRQRMIERLTGNHAMSAGRLAKDVGVSQDTLSRWLREAHTLPIMGKRTKGHGQKRVQGPFAVKRTVGEKVRILAAAQELKGEELMALLEREQITLAVLEGWRRALEERSPAQAASINKQVRDLERELARKDKALAEAAALLVLKKKLQYLQDSDEDDDEGPESDK